MNTTNRPYFQATGTRLGLVMCQLYLLAAHAPSTLNAAGTRNYGVVSILGVGITSFAWAHTFKLWLWRRYWQGLSVRTLSTQGIAHCDQRRHRWSQASEAEAVRSSGGC